MINNNYIKYFLVFLCISTLLASCGRIPKPDFSKKPIEPNARKRAQQNVIDGKGIQFFNNNKGDGKFLFASSNPLWKAALDTLDFISLANADYSGGVLITDWYSEDDPNEAIKITIRFLSNEIRADGMIVNLYKRTCVNNVCSTKEIKNDISNDIRNKILKKAAIYKTQDAKRAFEYRPKKKFMEKDETGSNN